MEGKGRREQWRVREEGAVEGKGRREWWRRGPGNLLPYFLSAIPFTSTSISSPYLSIFVDSIHCLQ